MRDLVIMLTGGAALMLSAWAYGAWHRQEYGPSWPDCTDNYIGPCTGPGYGEHTYRYGSDVR